MAARATIVLALVAGAALCACDRGPAVVGVFRYEASAAGIGGAQEEAGAAGATDGAGAGGAAGASGMVPICPYVSWYQAADSIAFVFDCRVPVERGYLFTELRGIPVLPPSDPESREWRSCDLGSLFEMFGSPYIEVCSAWCEYIKKQVVMEKQRVIECLGSVAAAGSGGSS